MKDNFGTVVEIIISVLIIIFIPIMLFGLVDEMYVRTDVKERTSVFTDTICNEKRITEVQLQRFTDALNDTGLLYDINLEVESNGVSYGHDAIIDMIRASGEFRLKDNDYVEVIAVSVTDCFGVRLAEMIDPFLPEGWIKVIDSKRVCGGEW